MIIEHSGDFKVVDPKTKEVRYDSTNVTLNLSSMNCSTWNIGKVTTGTAITIGNTTAEEKSTNPLKKSLSKKDQILELLKGETFEDIKDILEDVFEEVKYKAKY